MNFKKMTVKEVICNSVVTFAEYTALGTVDGEKITYEELKNRIQVLSAFLKNIGIKKGDRVAILAENSPNWGITYFSTLSLGAVLVPIMTEFQPIEIKHILKHSEAKAIFVSSKYYEKIDEIDWEFIENVILLDDFSIIPPKTKNDFFKEVLKNGQKEFNKVFEKVKEVVGLKNENVEEGDLALILYTSGTTGNSKGVMLTHKNIVYDAYATIKLVNIKNEDVMLSMLPLFHTFESTLGLLTPILAGASVYYLQKPPTPATLLPAFQKVKPTVLLAVPLIIEKIYKGRVIKEINAKAITRSAYKFPPLRKVINKVAGKKLYQTFGGNLKMFCIGGSPLAKEVEKFLIEAKFPYAMGYGLTETSPLVTGTTPQFTRFTSSGTILEGMEVKIATSFDEANEGEILIKGPNVMKGYYKDPERTSEVFTSDGYFRSGDLGHLDKDGYLFIKGRSKNMILGANGKNIYPEEIEQVINEQDFVVESIVVERNKKLTALVYLDQEMIDAVYGTAKMIESEARKIIEDLLLKIQTQVNEKVPTFAKVKQVIHQTEDFVKTPTHKVKRFLYH